MSISKSGIDLAGDLRKLGLQFKSVADAADTGTPSGRVVFHATASLDELDWGANKA